jgi:hypothetical protein
MHNIIDHNTTELKNSENQHTKTQHNIEKN